MIPVAVKEEGRRKRESTFPDRLLKLMREMFGVENVNWSREEEEKIEIVVDSNLAILNTKTLVRNGKVDCTSNVAVISLSLLLIQAVECSDDSLNHLVSTAAKRLQTSLSCQAT